MTNSDKIKFRIVTVVLVIMMISIVAVASTYAKYAGIIAESSDTAYIARWDISMNTADTLFNHDYMLELINTDENGQAMLAPGVFGKWDIALTNKGDVKANITKIAISKSSESPNVPIRFSIDNKKSWTYLNNGKIDVTNQIINIGETKKVETLYWEWPSEGNDVLDTLVGAASYNGNKKFTLIININAEQYMQ